MYKMKNTAYSTAALYLTSPKDKQIRISTWKYKYSKMRKYC
jgi:hypothetical protein